MAAGRWRQKGFYISETVVIFITKLIEMCVRLRSAAGWRGIGKSREGCGGAQELGAGLYVCVGGGGGVAEREQAILSGEKNV